MSSGDGGAGLRILVEPSDYIIRNLGDTAMMTVALERLSRMWPAARIQVLTDEPDRMPRPGANIEPLALEGRRLWLHHAWSIERRLPGKLASAAVLVRSVARHRAPRLALTLLDRLGDLTPEHRDAIWRYVDALSSADLLLVTGMGGITSAFPDYARELLEVVGTAQRMGSRTAFMGQGIGPLQGAGLRRRAAAVLRRADVLTLREGRAGLPLLHDLGVATDRVEVTGDDAIELACRLPQTEVGDAIGVNMRRATYAGTHDEDVQRVGPVLHAMRDECRASLIGLPISRVPGEEDARTIARLTGEAEAVLASIATPDAFVAALDQCRIAIVGSYHAGVFALSRGIPIVALVRSRYYVDKFGGLADMFGAGCAIVALGSPDFSDQLRAAVRAAWDADDAVRCRLRASAREQLARSRAAYLRLGGLVR